MISEEEYMEIKILHRQGKSIREIARTMHCSRNTVRKYLKTAPSLKSKRTYKKRASKLDGFKDYLKQRYESALPHRLPASVLYREIKEKGYTGGISILRNYLITFGQPIAEKVIRFETEPGQQMQVDWVVFKIGQERLSAFVAILGYSRATYVEFVENEKLETLLSCHEQAFNYFGGVPREILYDNMRTIVIKRDAYKKGYHCFNASFMDFAKHHNFVPKLCKPYRAQTKGKVERFNRYLRYSFYYPLVSKLKLLGLKLDLELANYEVKQWLRDVANQRIHNGTGKVPAFLLNQEQFHLQKINPYPKYLQQALPKLIRNTKPKIKLKITQTPPYIIQHPLSLYDAILHEQAV